MVELLAPARDKRSASAAINNDTDAIYVGITDYNMRANVANIDIDDIYKVISTFFIFSNIHCSYLYFLVCYNWNINC